jgi:hypothetical protein
VEQVLFRRQTDGATWTVNRDKLPDGVRKDHHQLVYRESCADEAAPVAEGMLAENGKVLCYVVGEEAFARCKVKPSLSCGASTDDLRADTSVTSSLKIRFHIRAAIGPRRVA